MNNKNAEILFKKFKIISCYKKNENSAVYLANHIFLDKKVFLKILNTQTIPDTSITERFKREAKILAQLEHPNIIKVFDFGMFEEYFYISFEYFESENLRELIARENLSHETKRNIFIQLVKSLDYAHQKDVIHRDIKPENILLNNKFELKLTDFGLAQDSIDNFITQQYSLVGTPAYMSPEQIQGEKLTLQSDMFSLGITAIELFSGKNPFLGETTNDTINNIISFDKNIYAELLNNLDQDITRILKGLLALKPENRFKSCSEILSILNIQNKYPETKPKSTIKKRWLAIVAILVLSGTWIIYNQINLGDPVETNIPILHELNVKTNDSLLITKNIAEENNGKTERDDNYLANVEKKTVKIDEIPQSTVSENNTSQPITNKTLTEEGELFIKCFPWAKIYLNNEYIETTPLSKNIGLKTGKYLLTLVHPDYPNYSDSISISDANLSFIEVNLDTLFGYFECQVYPWGDLFINGEKKGTTPLTNSIKLVEGTYQLELKNPKYESVKLPINISRKDTLRMRFNMESGVNY